MRTVNVHEAKTQLSKLLEAVESGEEVTIARAGRPVARLVGLAPAMAPRQLGQMAGSIQVPDDFSHMMADEVLALFQGEVDSKPKGKP